MSEDRSLTEFTAGSDDDADDSAEHNADASADEIADAHSTAGDDCEGAADADDASITFRFEPAGAVCSQCGATTKRQWVAEDVVCPDCKPW